MKGTTIFFLSILLITTGCKRLDQTTDDLITVDVTNNSFPKKELALQDFMDVEYIPLETNDDFVNQGFVQAIGKEFILVKNYRDDGDIFVYDRTGKAIRKINRKGQGGEEYISCRSVTLDEENNEMFINDFLARKIKVYDLEGNFKRSIKQKQDGDTQFYLDIFNYDKENLICYDECNQEIPFLLVSKQDGNITKEIRTPFKEKKLFLQLLRHEGGTRAAGPGEYSRNPIQWQLDSIRTLVRHDLHINARLQFAAVYRANTSCSHYESRIFLGFKVGFRSLLFHGKYKERI